MTQMFSTRWLILFYAKCFPGNVRTDQFLLIYKLVYNCMTHVWFLVKNQWWSGIQGPSGPRTDRSDLVRDFLNFIGPARSEISDFFVWSWSKSILDFSIFLSLFGPVLNFPTFLDQLIPVRGSLMMVTFLEQCHPILTQYESSSLSTCPCWVKNKQLGQEQELVLQLTVV